tara:strand:- start:5073 stop:6872 length:1800 start_codon:yes stop_codon:yes gene_type:complete
MSLKKTFLFFLIFAFIGTYYYLIEIKKAEKTKEIEKEEKRVFSPVKKEEISEITFEKENKKTLRLSKVNNTWKIKEPVEANIDKDSFDVWIDYVAKIPKESIVANSVKNIAEFGLDKPSFTVHVKTDDGSDMTLVSGDEIPTGNMFYSKLKNKDTIFMIASYNTVGIDKSAYELRDKKIFHFKNEEVEGFKVATMAGNYSVEKMDGVWQVVTPVKAPADAEKIASLLQKTRITDIKKFISEKADDLDSYGLNDPSTQISFLTGKDKAPHSLAFGIENTEEQGVYAKTSSKNKVFLIKKEFLNEFPYGVNDIRDKSIFQFTNDRINKIQFVFPDKTITTAKNEENNWEIIEPRKTKADNFEVNSVLNTLSSGKVIDFISKNKEKKNAFALKNPRLTVKLFEKDSAKPNTISFGADNQERKAVYADTGSLDEVVLIDNELFSKLDITEISLQYKYLLLINEDETARIHIKTSDKEYLIYRTEDKWTIEKPEKKKLETIKVKEVLWNLGDVKLTDIVEKSGKPDLSAFGLQNPAIKVNLQDDKGNDLESLFIGTKVKEANVLFAMTDKSNTIYSIEPKLRDEMMNSIKALLINPPRSDTKEN